MRPVASRAGLAGILSALALAGGLAAAQATPAQAQSAPTKVLAATPYMGWDTYFALGGNYSEATILRQASELISLGLEKRGYRYVWLDVGWWHGTRNANGEITVSASQWPHGLAWLTRTLHAAGFLVGLYTDAGPNGCGGAGQGSYGHYQQDVNTFAAWGFDAVKVDRVFVSGLGIDQHDSALVAAIFALARAFDLEVTAEGVETEGQLAHLKALHCHLAQGFYLAQALPASDITDLLARSHRWEVG